MPGDRPYLLIRLRMRESIKRAYRKKKHLQTALDSILTGVKNF